MSEERFILCNKTTDSNVWDTWEKQCYGWEYVVYLLNEQDRKINVLENSCSVMNQRLFEKEECNYKKAIIEFCKFMNINTPLLDVMVDEFLQEVFLNE